MKKIYFLLILFLVACSSNIQESNLNKKFTFSENMSFEEFKVNLKRYANQSTYPNIDR